MDEEDAALIKKRKRKELKIPRNWPETVEWVGSLELSDKLSEDFIKQYCTKQRIVQFDWEQRCYYYNIFFKEEYGGPVNLVATEARKRRTIREHDYTATAGTIYEFKNESYDSFLKPDLAKYNCVHTTKDDPRAELRYVRKRSLMEIELERIDDGYHDAVGKIQTWVKQVEKHHLYRDFLKAFELQENEFGWSTYPKRELELWDMWYFEQTGQEWKCSLRPLRDDDDDVEE